MIVIVEDRKKGISFLVLVCCMVFMGVLFYFWIVMMVVELILVEGIFYVGWVVFFLFFGVVIVIRMGMRLEDGIYGSMVEDFFVVMFLYLFVVF